jgi:hypothetical protein
MNTVQLCPKCGSGKVEHSGGIEASPEISLYKCLQCGWEGAKNQLIVAQPQAPDAQIVEVLSTPDMALGIAQEVSKQYLLTLSEEASGAIGRAMLRAGIVGGKEDPKYLGRLIRAATLAAHKATLTEIEAIQKEKRDGRE